MRHDHIEYEIKVHNYNRYNLHVNFDNINLKICKLL